MDKSERLWFVKRVSTTPDGKLVSLLTQFEAMKNSETVEELYARLEKADFFHRLDPSVRPTKNKCATVSTRELDLLRNVPVVRLGRVTRIEHSQVILEKGQLPTGMGTLYVDCSTDSLAPHPAVPVFQDGKITLQSVYMCQQVFSAGLIAHVEAMGCEEDTKNALCAPVPHPVLDEDLVLGLATTLENKAAWKKAGMDRWLKKSRLCADSHSPSLFTVLWFLCSNLCSLHKLASGPAKMEADVLANMRKLASVVQSRRHPRLLTSNLDTYEFEKEGVAPAAHIDPAGGAKDETGQG